MATATTPRSRLIAVSDLPWQDLMPGLRTKSIWDHAETNRRAMLTRLEPGAQLPRHRHVGDELIFVIEGGVADDFGSVTSGNVGYRPDGCVHRVTSANGATVLAVLTGRVEPAADAPAGPPSQIFTLSDLPWVDARPGLRHKKLWEDKTSERRAILARFEPGATLAPHRHVGDELIYVVEGANSDESGPVVAGAMNYRPQGCVHRVTTVHGATVLAIVWGHTEPI